MAARKTRVDPKTQKPLPEGIRYRADRNKYQVRIWATGLNGEARERTVLVETLAEAKRLRSDKQTQLRPNGAMTLEAWHLRYWSTIESEVRQATASAYDVSWRTRVKPWFGHKKLESITVGEIESAVVSWKGSASTRNDALSMLSRLLNGAARSGIIAANPAKLARRPKDDKIRSYRSRALTNSEVKAMLDGVGEGPYRDYLTALAYTGMRAGEASGLCVGDIELDHGIIHVRRSLSPGRAGKLVEQSPKSHKERAVPLPDHLRPMLERLIAGKRRGDLVFTGPRGGALSTSNVRRAVNWEALRQRLDRPDLRIHDLRHTFATILFDAGMAANDVQAILGHSSLQVTERYSRARSDSALRGAAALNAFLDN
ncbi:tyrosine-type recombinase/integrase [Paramicrobacterium fandaimingii]|uniref:tyrosine-type recombinase/integrase n=1 Tax=Paramicrobacterium fandaimingii TaxID=2708079 RepID=UPI001421BDB3|nr:site-specific integrase [Microbacterium fandaimingii]